MVKGLKYCSAGIKSKFIDIVMMHIFDEEELEDEELINDHLENVKVVIVS